MTYDTGSQYKYLVNYSDKQIILTSGTLAGDNRYVGSDLIIDYMRDLPIVKFGNNDSSIDAYGKRVKIIQDTNIKDPLTAATTMLTELENSSDPLKEGTLSLYKINNINVGDTCVVNIPQYGINSVKYDIIEVKYDMTKKNLLSDNIISIKVNRKVADITDTLKDIILQQKKLQGEDIQSTDLLTRYKVSVGSIGIRTSGLEVWTQPIGSSFILGHLSHGLLGSYASHNLGDHRLGSIIQWSGGYW